MNLRKNTKIWLLKSAGRKLENIGKKNLKENPRDFFNIFKPLLSNKTTKNNTLSLKTEDDVVENDANIVANSLSIISLIYR